MLYCEICDRKSCSVSKEIDVLPLLPLLPIPSPLPGLVCSVEANSLCKFTAEVQKHREEWKRSVTAVKHRPGCSWCAHWDQVTALWQLCWNSSAMSSSTCRSRWVTCFMWSICWCFLHISHCWGTTAEQSSDILSFMKQTKKAKCYY